MGAKKEDTQLTTNEPKSKSQQKQQAKETTRLGELLTQLSETQLEILPYPEIRASIAEYKKISKGNARKRQMLYIGKLLRSIDLTVIEQLVARYDSASDYHRLHIHQIEQWRNQLINDDPRVISQIGEECPELDRQHLMNLVRDAKAELSIPAEQSKPSGRAFKKLFQYLKLLNDQRLTLNAKTESGPGTDAVLQNPETL